MPDYIKQVIEELQKFRRTGGSINNKKQVLADPRLVEALKKACHGENNFSNIMEQTWQKINPEIKIK